MATETVDGTPYYIGWVFFVIVLIALIAKVQSLDPVVIVTTDFKKFQRGFIHVYLIALGSEWLQSCYLFVLLHKSYGFRSTEIAGMFIFGLLACQISGLIWDLLDFGSRKSRCFLCLALQIVSCLLMVQVSGTSYHTFVVARLISGVASSILQGSFEQWMHDSHYSNGFPDDWLKQTFIQLSFSTARLAIAVGVIGEVSMEMLGYKGPFVAALILSLSGLVLLHVVWKPDQRHAAFGVPPAQACVNLSSSRKAICTNPKTLWVVAVQSCFEAVIYIFSFQWTPTLNATLPHTEGTAPYGFIYSMFLISIMMGSFSFRILTNAPKPGKSGDEPRFTPEALCTWAFRGAVVALFFLAVFHVQYLVVVSCVLFQFCVGMFFPSMGNIRGKYVPPDTQAAVVSGSKFGVFIIVLPLLYLYPDERLITYFLCMLILGVGIIATGMLLKQKNHTLNLKDQASV